MYHLQHTKALSNTMKKNNNKKNQEPSISLQNIYVSPTVLVLNPDLTLYITSQRQ